MLDLIGAFVVALLVAPPLVFAAGGVLLVLAHLLPASPRRLRETFRCPWMRRTVTADFLVAEGAAHPAGVSRCTAFANPAQVTCARRCRELTDVRWGLSRIAFPRWSLTAGGPVNWRDAEGGVRGH